MTWLEALIQGIVEGLTEYLPVSSTGHLLITQRLQHIAQSDATDAFVVCIQPGAILAVLLIYFPHVKSITLGFLGKNPAGLKLGINLVAAFLPAAIIGVLGGKFIKSHLFGSLPILLAWLIGGVFILVWCQIEKSRAHGKDPQIIREAGSSIEEISWKQALGIGCFQCIAMCPGVSRSLATIMGGKFMKLSLNASVEFSFLLGLITLSAATAKDSLDNGAAMLREIGPFPILVGILASWISAAFAVKWMVGYLQKHSLAIFGWYRIAAAIAGYFIFFNPF